MSYNFLTLLLTLFLRDHNVSLPAPDVEEDLPQALRICMFTNNENLRDLTRRLRLEGERATNT